MARWAKAVRAALKERRCAEAAAAVEEQRRRAGALAFPARLDWVEPLLAQHVEDANCPICPTGDALAIYPSWPAQEALTPCALSNTCSPIEQP